MASRSVMDSLAELAPTLGGIASAPDLYEEERATDRLTTMAEQAHASISPMRLSTRRYTAWERHS